MKNLPFHTGLSPTPYEGQPSLGGLIYQIHTATGANNTTMVVVFVEWFTRVINHQIVLFLCSILYERVG